MANITEHDSKEEGECNDREQSRIHLLVVGHTICINNLLKWSCEVVGFEESRGNEALALLLPNLRPLNILHPFHISNPFSNGCNRSYRSPEKAN